MLRFVSILKPITPMRIQLQLLLIVAIVNLSAWFELEILTELTYCNDHFPAVCQTELDKGGKKVGTSKANTRSINGSCWLFIETLSVLKKINGSISKFSVVYYS